MGLHLRSGFAIFGKPDRRADLRRTAISKLFAIILAATASAVAQIQVAPGSLAFSGESGGSSPAPQNLSLTSNPSTSFNIGVVTGGGSNWLAVSPTSGRTPATLLVNANPVSLAPGTYQGTITILPTQGNAITVSVALTVTAPAPPHITVSLDSLTFSVQIGGSSPAQQSFSVTANRSVSFTVTAATASGGSWLAVSPTSGTTPATLDVIVNPTGLAPGTYQGAIIITTSNESVKVTVTLLIQKGCAASKLFPAFASSISASTGLPVPITVQVVDDCGNQINSGGVFVTFSNGDPPIALQSTGNGRWVGTWVPKSTAQTVTITAVAAMGNLAGSAQIVTTIGQPPTLNPPSVAATLDSASYTVGRPLSPGSFVAIFGSNLADNTAQATSLPLPTMMGGTSVIVGGTSIPLFFVSSSQINAILPYSLPLNTSVQVIVQRSSTFSTPASINIAAANPAVFTISQQGTGQGAILNQDFSLNGPGKPAARGSFVAIYCLGLGATNPPAIAGQFSNTIQTAVNTVSVTIGGQAATVAFAGLAPGFTGLYQVNAVVPSGAIPGDQVPVVLTVAGQSSPVVSMAVR